MDTNTVIALVIFVFALVITAAFLSYRSRGSANIKGPFGIGLAVEGENKADKPKTGISAREITSREGKIVVKDTTGQGLDIKQIDAKDDVLLSSSIQQMTTKAYAPQPISGLSSQGLRAGGNITIQQYVGGEVPIDEQISFFVRQLGLEKLEGSRFEIAQYEAYSSIWKKLQGLRLAGEDLWDEETTDNLIRFSELLIEVEEIVINDDLLFEDADRRNLSKVLRSLRNFLSEKKRMIAMGSKQQLDNMIISDPMIYQQAIRSQIKRNFDAKKEYEELLVDIRISFRNKLSSL